jgi:mono/diheme cytochrome c family protein
MRGPAIRCGLLAAAIALFGTAAARADEQPVPLKDAPGRDVVENNCAACHSLDYPRTNAPFLDRKMWQAEVDKMINVFGAPIEPRDAKAIVDYLTKNYGTGS